MEPTGNAPARWTPQGQEVLRKQREERERKAAKEAKAREKKAAKEAKAREKKAAKEAKAREKALREEEQKVKSEVYRLVKNMDLHLLTRFLSTIRYRPYYDQYSNKFEDLFASMLRARRYQAINKHRYELTESMRQDFLRTMLEDNNSPRDIIRTIIVDYPESKDISPRRVRNAKRRAHLLYTDTSASSYPVIGARYLVSMVRLLAKNESLVADDLAGFASSPPTLQNSEPTASRNRLLTEALRVAIELNGPYYRQFLDAMEPLEAKHDGFLLLPPDMFCANVDVSSFRSITHSNWCGLRITPEQIDAVLNLPDGDDYLQCLIDASEEDSIAPSVRIKFAIAAGKPNVNLESTTAYHTFHRHSCNHPDTNHSSYLRLTSDGLLLGAWHNRLIRVRRTSFAEPDAELCRLLIDYDFYVNEEVRRWLDEGLRF